MLHADQTLHPLIGLSPPMHSFIGPWLSPLLRPCSEPAQFLQLGNCGCRIVKNLSTMACTDPAQQLSGQGAAQAGTAQQAPTEELPASQSAEGIARQVLHSSRIQIAVD